MGVLPRIVVTARMAIVIVFVLGMPLLALPPVLERVDRFFSDQPAVSFIPTDSEPHETQPRVWIVRE